MAYLEYSRAKKQEDKYHYIRVKYKGQWLFYVAYDYLSGKLALATRSSKASRFRYGNAYAKVRNLQGYECILQECKDQTSKTGRES